MLSCKTQYGLLTYIIPPKTKLSCGLVSITSPPPPPYFLDFVWYVNHSETYFFRENEGKNLDEWPKYAAILNLFTINLLILGYRTEYGVQLIESFQKTVFPVNISRCILSWKTHHCLIPKFTLYYEYEKVK